MAANDQNDFASRVRSYFAAGWFGDVANTPVLNALLQGIGYVFATLCSQLAYLRLQTRIKTASDNFLDIIALDFFGGTITRAPNQSDAAFRNVILINLFRERPTRYGVIKVLTDLTGRTPIVFEPSRPMDAFCLDVPQNGCLDVNLLGGYEMPGEVLITAYRPLAQGVGIAAGLDSTYSGLDGGYMALIDPNAGANAVTDAQIYAAVESVRPDGIKNWVNIQS